MSWSGWLVPCTSTCLWRKSGGVRPVPLLSCHRRRPRCITAPQVIFCITEPQVFTCLIYALSGQTRFLFSGRQITKTYIVCFWKSPILCYFCPSTLNPQKARAAGHFRTSTAAESRPGTDSNGGNAAALPGHWSWIRAGPDPARQPRANRGPSRSFHTHWT